MNKSTWGGRREGAGRKPTPYAKRRIVLHIADDAEMESILELSPRERTEILLNYIQERKK